MPCSPAQREANKRNSLKSTGPKDTTRSRGNALKHGLTATVLVTPEEAAAMKDLGPAAVHLAGEVVLLTMRIERAQQTEERERARAALRSVQCWDDDRSDEAESVARGLSRDPQRITRKLRRTVHGCAWLIEQWELLRVAAAQPGGWTDSHQTHAADLRGLPIDLRFGTVPAAQQTSLIDRELAALKARQTKLKPCDEFDRESARCGLSNEATPELRRVLRYEAALNRRLQWALNHAPKVESETKPIEPPAPAPAPQPKPVPKAPSINFDRDFDLPPGWSPGDLPPAMGSVLPLSMIPTGSHARVG